MAYVKIAITRENLLRNFLRYHPNGISWALIEDTEGLHTPQALVFIREMEADGLLHTDANNIVHPTAKGRELVEPPAPPS